MNKTKIEWVRNPDGSPGWTFNPITGCLNNCSYCYARKLANTRLKKVYLANGNIALVKGIPATIAVDGFMSNPFYPRFWPERLKELQPIGGLVCELVYPPRTRKGIFVCDMSDLFGIGIPDEWTQAVLKVIKKWPAHRFYLLTKQPQNLIKFSPFPDNCWVGVSVDNEGVSYPDMMLEACRALGAIKAKVKYISFEPLLTSIYRFDVLEIWGINWVIIGAQTKPYKPPDKLWVAEIIEACKKAGIPYFLKDNLRPLLGNNLVQDMPKGVEIDH